MCVCMCVCMCVFISKIPVIIALDHERNCIRKLQQGFSIIWNLRQSLSLGFPSVLQRSIHFFCVYLDYSLS